MSNILKNPKVGMTVQYWIPPLPPQPAIIARVWPDSTDVALIIFWDDGMKLEKDVIPYGKRENPSVGYWQYPEDVEYQ